MDKAKNLGWFTEIQKVKMMKHEENPVEMGYFEMMRWLQEEVNELEHALKWESRENVVKESADVANLAYFIANKIKEEGLV